MLLTVIENEDTHVEKSDYTRVIIKTNACLFNLLCSIIILILLFEADKQHIELLL